MTIFSPLDNNVDCINNNNGCRYDQNYQSKIDEPCSILQGHFTSNINLPVRKKRSR